MDPHAHQLSTMDPKLKEAYQKVMSTPIPTPGNQSTDTKTPEEKPTVPPPGIQQTTVDTPTQTVTTTVTTQPKMITEEQKEETIAAPTPNSVPEAPKEEPKHIGNSMVFTSSGKPHQATGTIHIGYSAKPGTKVVLEKKKLGIPPALYIVGCVLFFALYTIFWIKVFGVKVPFLP